MSTEPAPTDPERPGRIKQIASTITVIAGLAAVVSSGQAYLNDGDEKIKRGRAQQFLTLYFASAISDPQSTFDNMLTDGFRELSIAAQPGYNDYWNKVNDVAVHKVSRTSDKNYFRVQYTVTYKGSRSEDISSRLHFICGSEARRYTPWLECRADQLQLDDSEAA